MVLLGFLFFCFFLFLVPSYSIHRPTNGVTLPVLSGTGRGKGRKHGALRPQKPLKVIRDGEVGGGGCDNFTSNAYSLHCHHQNDSALRWAAE